MSQIEADICELMESNQDILEKNPSVHFIGDDFLALSAEYNNSFDRIIANPPFSKNQDIDHIYKMYDVLADGGRIVTIASKHWQHSSKNKEKAFREWLDSVGAEIEDVGAGEFKESGTNVATVIIVIDK